jgi:hypothetical protein
MRTPKAIRTQIVALLASGRTQREASQATGVSEVCISNWMTKDPEFKRQVDDAIAVLDADLRARLRGSMQRAFAALLEVLAADNANAKARAAIALLHAGGYLRDKAEGTKQDIVVEFGESPVQNEDKNKPDGLAAGVP